jgi:hypothetical protein
MLATPANRHPIKRPAETKAKRSPRSGEYKLKPTADFRSLQALFFAIGFRHMGVHD